MTWITRGGSRSLMRMCCVRSGPDVHCASRSGSSHNIGRHGCISRASQDLALRRHGDSRPLPHGRIARRPLRGIESAEALFKQFLADDKIDGWVYVQEEDGYLHPYLVADIKFEHADISRDARVKITMEADSPTVQRPSKTPRLLLLEDSAIVG